MYSFTATINALEDEPDKTVSLTNATILKYNAGGTTRHVLLKYNAGGITRCVLLKYNAGGIYYIGVNSWLAALNVTDASVDIDIPILLTTID